MRHRFTTLTQNKKCRAKNGSTLAYPLLRNLRGFIQQGRVMASIFWDSQGVIMIDYLEQGHTINGAYYAGKLRWLHQEIERKRRGKLTHSVLLLEDNAPYKRCILCRQLRWLHQEIERKRRGKLTCSVLLLEDNAPAHKLP